MGVVHACKHPRGVAVELARQCLDVRHVLLPHRHASQRGTDRLSHRAQRTYVPVAVDLYAIPVDLCKHGRGGRGHG